MLLESAATFGDEVANHRSELLVHCYRMLGTLDEAEDALQEALTRAWQGRQTFRRSISFRAWLYRIATNVCLNAIEVRKRGRVDRPRQIRSDATIVRRSLHPVARQGSGSRWNPSELVR